jgi:hypothetical protein
MWAGERGVENVMRKWIRKWVNKPLFMIMMKWREEKQSNRKILCVKCQWRGTVGVWGWTKVMWVSYYIFDGNIQAWIYLFSKLIPTLLKILWKSIIKNIIPNQPLEARKEARNNSSGFRCESEKTLSERESEKSWEAINIVLMPKFRFMNHFLPTLTHTPRSTFNILYLSLSRF